MKVIALQSGSNGNCIYVEAGGVRLLFDAGISGRQAEQRLAAHGRDIRRVDALLISHDHVDHARCMGIYQRKFGLPIFVTRKTLAATQVYKDLGNMNDIRHFTTGDKIRFGKVTVETIGTPHDSADGVVFVVDDGERRFGIMTDLGHVFKGLDEIVDSLDAVLIESNYDPELLDSSPYPEHLKNRIRGPGGHVSNVESAELLSSAGRKLIWACLAHLSGENNDPELARRAHYDIIGKRLSIHVADRNEATDVLEV